MKRIQQEIRSNLEKKLNLNNNKLFKKFSNRLNQCRVTGILKTITEISAYLYVMQFSYLILRKVTNPTADFQRLKRITHAISIIIPLCYSGLMYFTVKFGISVMVTCGLKNTENSLLGLSRCWPVLMLPFSYYNCYSLYRNSYKLVQSDVQYFLIQYTFYLFFFGLYLFYGLGLSVASLFTEFISNEELEMTYVHLRESFLVLKLVQLVALLFVTFLPRNATIKLQYILCKCFFKTQPRVVPIVHIEQMDEEKLLSNSINSKYYSAVSKERKESNKAIIGKITKDEQFKRGYNAGILEKKTTFVLKTSYHLINVLLMSLCSVFQRENINGDNLIIEEEISNLSKEQLVHSINLPEFNKQNGNLSFDKGLIKQIVEIIQYYLIPILLIKIINLCLYDIENNAEDIKVIEHAPQIFQDIRRKFGISNGFMFKSFIPIHNFEAIHNFFPGSGKSSSFFFFSDNKAFVLKTLKDSEKALLLDKGVLQSYYKHIKSTERTLISKIFGVYTIRMSNMSEINCYIMENLLGKDFPFIERIYDLKGSTKGRRAKITQEQLKAPTGLKVLKDLNYIEIGEKVMVEDDEKERLHKTIESDARFIAENNLMDYSLLLIKIKVEKQEERKVSSKFERRDGFYIENQAISVPKSIIDYINLDFSGCLPLSM